MSFIDVIGAVSDAFVARLAAVSYPALDAGAVQVGIEFLSEQRAYPRVVVVPDGGAFSGKDVYNTIAVSTVAKSVATWTPMAEVHVWAANFAQAEQYMMQFILALHSVNPGNWVLARAKFNNETPIEHYGRELVFMFGVHEPVVDTPLSRAPSDTKTAFTTNMQFPDSTTVQACQG